MTHILVTSLSFDSAMGGGGVRIAYDLATCLAEGGHRITVVCEDLHNRNLEKEIINGITVLRYRLPRAWGLGVRREERHLEATRQLLEKYLDGPPDIVHGHSLFQYIGALRHYEGKVRSCYTIHSPFVDELRIVWGAQGLIGQIKIGMGLWIIRRLEKECLMSSSILTAESEFTRNLIQSDYGEACSKRIKVIPGWVDLKSFVPLSTEGMKVARGRLGWPNDRTVFFVLRRLEARMGLDNLLQALALVKKRGFRPYTVIGGNGSLKTHLIKMRDSLDLQGDVVFIGFVPANQISLAYGACDASIIPTAQLECFGIIALEALACGKTTLITPVGALPEVMRNFEPQWIAPKNTTEGIADLLCKYLRGSLPQHSPDELRTVIARRYTMERAIEQYERVLVGK